jgi:hypothetical protein
MFGVQGDLAHQRKLEKPVVTMEKVAADEADAPAPENSVVTPDSA